MTTDAGVSDPRVERPTAGKLGPADVRAVDAQAGPRVVVLMSIYQGERFIREQVDSILSQLPANGTLLVRDDGSRDRSAELVEAVGDPRVELERGPNLGFGASFLTLLMKAPTDADMVMFADQDDVWLPGKIERAWLHLLATGPGPALYGSAQILADEHLRPLQPTPPWRRPPSFETALMENIITGCTAALNRPAAQLLKRAGVPAGVQFHDWWAYLVVSAFGTVVFDSKPTLLYRQHGSNQIGHGVGRFGRQLQMLRFLARNDWVAILLAQLNALLEHFGGELQPEARGLLESYFHKRNGFLIPRWRLVFSWRRWRQRAIEEPALRFLLAGSRLGLWPRGANRRGSAVARQIDA